jgi:hypothetical protein
MVRDEHVHRIRGVGHEIALQCEVALLGGQVVGRVLTPAVPVLSPNAGKARATSAAVAKPRLSAGRRKTRSMIAAQKRPSGFARSTERRLTIRRRMASTRSCRSPSSAGSSVSATASEVMPTRIAPAARLRKIVEGTISRPNMATTNADPLNRTARLAVPPVATIASSGSPPRPRSSRYREMMNNA